MSTSEHSCALLLPNQGGAGGADVTGPPADAPTGDAPDGILLIVRMEIPLAGRLHGCVLLQDFMWGYALGRASGEDVDLLGWCKQRENWNTDNSASYQLGTIISAKPL